MTTPACSPLVARGLDLWHPAERETPATRTAREREAIRVCRDCPLLTACDQAARDLDDLGDSIWAGLTAATRARRGGRACAEKAGTIAGYRRHHRAHQKVCGACRDAWNARKRDDRAKGAA